MPYLTYDEVQARFPGAIDALKDDYQAALDDDPESFKHQFEVDNVDALVKEVIKFYEVDDFDVSDGVTVAFTEPNLGTNVQSVWTGEEWDA